MPPEFTAVVVTYQQAPYVETALRSALRQTERDAEFLVADDGSTDGTRERVEAIARDSRRPVRILDHPGRENRGIQATHQLALREASGRYIAFLEGDDIWSPRYLETKRVAFERHPEVGVVFSPYRVIRQGRWGWEMALRQWCLHLLVPKNRPFDNFRHLLRKNNAATFSGIVIRASALAELPPTSAEDRLLYYDWWVLLQLSMRHQFYLDTRSSIRWRQHSDSALRQQSFSEHRSMLLRFFDRSYSVLDVHPDLSPELAEAVGRQQGMAQEFSDLYSHPTLGRFGRLFNRDPVWAIETLVSHMINRCKSRGTP